MVDWYHDDNRYMCLCNVHVTFVHFDVNPDQLQKGVLSQELDDWLANKLPPNHNYTAYIASRY